MNVRETTLLDTKKFTHTRLKSELRVDPQNNSTTISRKCSGTAVLHFQDKCGQKMPLYMSTIVITSISKNQAAIDYPL